MIKSNLWLHKGPLKCEWLFSCSSLGLCSLPFGAEPFHDPPLIQLCSLGSCSCYQRAELSTAFCSLWGAAAALRAPHSLLCSGSNKLRALRHSSSVLPSRPFTVLIALWNWSVNSWTLRPWPLLPNSALFWLSRNTCWVSSPSPYDNTSHIPTNHYKYRGADNRTPVADWLLSGKHILETRSFLPRSFPPILGIFVEEDGFFSTEEAPASREQQQAQANACRPTGGQCWAHGGVPTSTGWTDEGRSIAIRPGQAHHACPETSLYPLVVQQELSISILVLKSRQRASAL